MPPGIPQDNSETLSESEARFRTIVEMAPDAIFIADEDGRFIEVNQAACDQLGYTRDELLGMTVFEIVTPECVEQARGHIGDMTDEYGFFESCHQRRDGTQVPVELSLRIVSYQTRPAMVAVVRDITERRKVEEEKQAFYRATIFSVTDGKLEIVSHDDLNCYVESAEYRARVNSTAEIHSVRRAADKFAQSAGLEGEDLAMFAMAVGEAITNAVKHAQEGQVYAGSTGGSVWVMVSDKGPGIDTLALPKVALLRGFSTKTSLGLGYSVMLDACDQVQLATDRSGTDVVLTKKVLKTNELVLLKDMPDTWDQVG